MTEALPPQIDVLVLGAGAAGLFFAGRAATPQKTVLVLDHAKKPAEKVRISGGGRCNFTNLETDATRFLSQNPHFAKSALARYTPWDFCSLMADHGLTWHEKTLGQLFCDQKSGAVIKLLLDELEAAGGRLELQTDIASVSRNRNQFNVSTSRGNVTADKLVIATGGLSIPKMGATSLAYDVARDFGHEIVTPRPALVPLTFSGALKDQFSDLSGIALPVEASAKTGPSFAENLLFTHRGLSGPAVLQISSYWQEGEPVCFNLGRHNVSSRWLIEEKTKRPRQTIGEVFGSLWPKRFVDVFARTEALSPTSRLGEISAARLEALSQSLSAWSVKPTGTEGWRTAEVTAGGVSTAQLSSQTMESKLVENLYFIGECVDVTGWLGGYNFQWAWASAAAAADAVSVD